MSNNDDITIRKKTEKGLRKSEEYYRHLVKNISEVFWSANADGKSYYVSSTIKTILGFSVEEFLSLPDSGWNLIHPDYQEKVRKAYDDLFAKKKLFSIEYPIKKKDGKYIWIHDRAYKIYEKEGQLFADGLLSDITERKKMEQKLKESEKKYHSLILHIPDVIWTTDSAGNTTFITPNIEKIYGYRPEEIYKEGDRLWFGRIHSDDIEKVKKAYKALFEKQVQFDIEYRIRRKDGKWIWAHDKATIIYERESVLYADGVFSDITERKKAEEELGKYREHLEELVEDRTRALKEKEERLSSFMESATDGFFLYDSELNIIDVNKAGLSLWSAAPNLKETGRYDKYMEVVKTGIPFFVEDVGPHPGFGEIHLAIRAFKVGKGMGLIATDITERKKSEEALKESEANYRNAYNRAEFYKDLFTHDINNILQNILMGIQLSETYIGDPKKIEKKLKKYNSIIKDQLKRGANLVSNIRKLSKLEEAEILIKKVEIYSILEKSITYMKNAYQDRNIDIQVDSIGKKLYVQANELLEDVFENILVNAIKYNEDSMIEIEIKISNNERDNTRYIKMEFLDNGKGIEDNRKKIIFKRGYSEAKSIIGMGLGLSLVKEIIKTYNGKIWVEDRVKGDYSKGSNFIVLIPEVS